MVTLTNTAWFPTIPPGTTTGVTIGFTAGIPVQAPAHATFNGLACPPQFPLIQAGGRYPIVRRRFA